MRETSAPEGHLSGEPQAWLGADVISVRQLSKAGVDLVMATAADMKQLVQRQGTLCISAPPERRSCLVMALMLRT
jgi:hypothetical protein